MREVLMIHNKFSEWLSALDNTASQHNINFTYATNLEECFGKIKEYPENIEAIVLGLSIGHDKMKWIEGLQKIRKIFKYIPIMILSSKTDDLHFIIENIPPGEQNYFVKPNLNPGLLFLQIERAIHESNHHKKHLENGINLTDKDEKIPALYISIKNDNSFKVYFAYRLNSIACASFNNKHETEYLCQIAYEWHLNFLNTLTFYDSDLTIRIRYLYKPGSEYIDPLLVVELNALSMDQAITRFEEVYHEFDIFIQDKKDFGKATYYFSPVIDEIDLRNILFPFTTENFIQLSPELIQFTTSYSKIIGFSISTDVQEDRKIYIPTLLKPEIKLDSFCEQLFHQRTKTMVEIVLTPIKLTKQDIDFLKESLNSISSYKFAGLEKDNACETINEFLITPSKCFRVEVFEAQENGIIGKSFVSAISAAFFGRTTHVSAAGVKINKGDILKKEDEVTLVRNWNNLYTLKNIVNVFKFPYPFSTTIPGIRSFPPVFGFLPENLSKTGVLTGLKNDGSKETPIKIGIEDLRKHLYILGQTGTGKTTVLYSMIMDRIVSGKGVCVIDPHGDLYKKILDNIPEDRIKDVIQFEPGDPDNTIRINLLEYNKNNPSEKSFLIDDLFNFFRQEYDVNQTMGPMFELFMKNSLLLLMNDADNLGSIGDISSIFQNAEFRNDLISKCKDREVVEFWRETALKLSGDYTLVNFTPYITSKLNQLLINDYIKPIVVTKKSNIDFREIIDKDKILLVSLSKGKIGKIGVNILGTIILSRIVNAALSRENIPENYRNDFTLFVDEFQNFISQSIIYAMSEARKYRLSLVLANQTLGQLNDSIKQSVLGNVGNTIFFRPGINDVDNIMPYFTPYLTRENVLTLPNYKCIGRFQIMNALSLPFIFDTIPPDKVVEFLKL